MKLTGAMMDTENQSHVLADLVLRANAAVVDMGIVGVCCMGVYWCGVYSDPPRTVLAWGFGGVLIVWTVVEMLTGVTIGKAAFGLTIRAADGPRAPMWRLIVRALIRAIPVVVFIPSVLVRNTLVSLAICLGAATLAVEYLAVCYLLILRKKKTLFDAAARTIVVRRVGPMGAR
jgi:uncharacterized RDD family membrane protein YckC